MIVTKVLAEFANNLNKKSSVFDRILSFIQMEIAFLLQ